MPVRRRGGERRKNVLHVFQSFTAFFHCYLRRSLFDTAQDVRSHGNAQPVGEEFSQRFRLVEATISVPRGVQRNGGKNGRRDERRFGRNKIDKLLGEVGDEAVLEGFDGFSDDPVVTEKTRQSIQGICCLAPRVGQTAECGPSAHGADGLALVNDADRRFTPVAEVLPELPAPEAALGENEIQYVHTLWRCRVMSPGPREHIANVYKRSLFEAVCTKNRQNIHTGSTLLLRNQPVN